MAGMVTALAELDHWLDGRRRNGRRWTNLGAKAAAIGHATIEGDTAIVDGPAIVNYGTASLAEVEVAPAMEPGDVFTFRIGHLRYDGDANEDRILNARSTGAGFTLYRQSVGSNAMRLGMFVNSTAGIRGANASALSDVAAEDGFVWGRVTFNDNGVDAQSLTFESAPDAADGHQVWAETETVPFTGVYDALIPPAVRLDYFSGRPVSGAGSQVEWRRADGTIVRRLTGEDVPDDPSTDSFDISSGQTVTWNYSGATGTTVMIPAGTSAMVNPDHTDAGNKVTTGQGIVTKAVAVFGGAASDNLVVAGTETGANLNVGDMEFRAEFGPGFAVPASNAVLWSWSNFGGGGTDPLEWWFRNDRLGFRIDGISYTVVSAPPASGAHILRGRIDVDNGASGWDVTFDYSTDNGETWSAIGSTLTTAGAFPTLDAPNTQLGFGRRVGSGSWPLPNGLPLVAASVAGTTPDVTITPEDLGRGAEGESSFPCSTGQVVTVNGNVGWSVSEWAGVEPTATFDGQSGSYESVPDAPEFDIIGDLCIVARVALDDWTPSSGVDEVLGKFAIPQRSYGFRVSSTIGTLSLAWSTDGSSANAGYSTVAMGASDGDRQWIAVALDVDNGASGHDVKFWTGGNGDTPVWTQLGTTVTTAGTTSIHAGTAPLLVGSDGSANMFDGSIEYIALFDGIGDGSAPGLGTKVFERNQVDVARAAEAGVGDGESYPSASGHTVTRNGGVTYSGSAPYVIPADKSAILGGLSVVGVATGSFDRPLRIGPRSGLPRVEFALMKGDTEDRIFARLHHSTEFDAEFDQSPGVDIDPTALAFYCAHIDRTANLLRNIVIDSAGVRTETNVDISSVGAIVVTEGITALASLPGACGGIVAHIAGTIASTDVDLIASLMLNPPTPEDGPLRFEQTSPATDLYLTELP